MTPKDKVKDDKQLAALQHTLQCRDIALKARLIGLNVTTAIVNQHYQRFTEWSEGRMLTGYLVRVTGITWIAGREEA